MTAWQAQPGSTVVLRTTASGMLARLAHDLELKCSRVELDIEGSPDSWSGTLTLPVSGISVAGAVKAGRVDPGILSASDRSDIEKKLRRDVLSTDAITIEFSEGCTSGATAEVRGPKGSQRLDVVVRFEEAGVGFHVTGTTKVSMRGLGVREVKGPLGAFRVDDSVMVLWDIEVAKPES